MYKSFEVQNFRGISQLRLEDMGPVNLLTGLNDAGKTSTLEAFLLHAAGPMAGVEVVQLLRPIRGQQQLAVTPGAPPESPWESLFHDFDLTIPIELSGEERSGKYRLALSAVEQSGMADLGGGVPQTGVGFSSSMKVTEKQGNQAAKSFVQSIIARPTGIPLINNGINLEYNSQPPALAPHERHILVRANIGPDLATGFSEVRKRANAPDLLESLQQIDERIQHLEVLVNNGRAELHADLGGTMVPFQLLGDGPVAMARYLVAMTTVPGGTLLIDEVGSGLHYTVLPKMWRALYRAASRLDVQIIATTHSFESVVAASQVIKDHQNDLSLFRLKRAAHGEPTTVSNFSGSKLETAIDFNTELR